MGAEAGAEGGTPTMTNPQIGDLPHLLSAEDPLAEGRGLREDRGLLGGLLDLLEGLLGPLEGHLGLLEDLLQEGPQLGIQTG